MPPLSFWPVRYCLVYAFFILQKMYKTCPVPRFFLFIIVSCLVFRYCFWVEKKLGKNSYFLFPFFFHLFSFSLTINNPNKEKYFFSFHLPYFINPNITTDKYLTNNLNILGMFFSNLRNINNVFFFNLLGVNVFWPNINDGMRHFSLG